MKLFPSNLSAILTGFIGMPLFLSGLKILNKHNFNDVLLVIWSLVAFLLPMLLSVFDYKFFYKIYERDGSLFRSPLTDNDMKVYLFPAMKRIVLYFFSSVTVLLLCSFFRVL